MSNIPTIEVSGVLDEFFDYDSLFDKLPKEVIFDLEMLTRINSCGVREWIRRIMVTSATIYYKNCPPVFVDQMSMVPQLLTPRTKVVSFLANFSCDACGAEKTKVYEIGKDIVAGQPSYDDPEEITCSHCGGEMEFAHNPHIFFGFLSHQKKAS